MSFIPAVVSRPRWPSTTWITSEKKVHSGPGIITSRSVAHRKLSTTQLEQSVTVPMAMKTAEQAMPSSVSSTDSRDKLPKTFLVRDWVAFHMPRIQVA